MNRRWFAGRWVGTRIFLMRAPLQRPQNSSPGAGSDEFSILNPRGDSAMPEHVVRVGSRLHSVTWLKTSVALNARYKETFHKSHQLNRFLQKKKLTDFNCQDKLAPYIAECHKPEQ